MAGIYLATEKEFRFDADNTQLQVANKLNTGFDSLLNTFFIPAKNEKPFTESTISEYLTILEIPSQKIPYGDYVISFHYHYTQEKQEYIDNNLIIEKKKGGENGEWAVMKPMRQASGYYPGFLVFEQNIVLDPQFSYKFFLNGNSKKTFRISNVLLRPENKTVIFNNKDQQLINNFPF